MENHLRSKYHTQIINTFWHWNQFYIIFVLWGKLMSYLSSGGCKIMLFNFYAQKISILRNNFYLHSFCHQSFIFSKAQIWFESFFGIVRWERKEAKKLMLVRSKISYTTLLFVYPSCIQKLFFFPIRLNHNYFFCEAYVTILPMGNVLLTMKWPKNWSNNFSILWLPTKTFNKTSSTHCNE